MKYEFKYIVPVSLMDQLRESISPYVELDPLRRWQEKDQRHTAMWVTITG